MPLGGHSTPGRRQVGHRRFIQDRPQSGLSFLEDLVQSYLGPRRERLAGKSLLWHCPNDGTLERFDNFPKSDLTGRFGQGKPAAKPPAGMDETTLNQPLKNL